MINPKILNLSKNVYNEKKENIIITNIKRRRRGN